MRIIEMFPLEFLRDLDYYPNKITPIEING